MRGKIMSILILAAMLFSGCTKSSVDKVMREEAYSVSSGNISESEKIVKDVFAMDTYMTLTAYGNHAEDAINAAIAEVERLDSLLSIGKEDSEISCLNKNGNLTLSEDTAYIMESALMLYKQTGGAFNPAMYPLMEAWGFTSQNYRVPEKSELQQLLKLIDCDELHFNFADKKAEFGISGMMVDLGGIAKGYTSSKLMDVFSDNGVTSGIVSLGGNVQTLGSKPDGSPWRVAVQNPDGSNDYIGVLEICDKAVITSGGYERYFEQDGKSYHHIIDPSTGYPAESGLKSVTIVSADGTLADGLSTALFVMGLVKATSFWQENSDMFDAILLTDDDILYVTEGIQNSFSSSYEQNIITKEGISAVT